MPFSRTLLFGALLFAAAVAQNFTPIAFTTLPGASVQACVPVQLAWSGGDGSSDVTITLKQGPATNLASVAIITGTATGNNYTWTPDSTLPDATDYALQISQGVDDINYSGTFALTGGSSSTSCGAANSTTTSSMSSSSTTSGVTAIIVAGPTGNATIVNPTLFTTTLSGTAVSSGGTGIPMSRNTTLSSAALSSKATGTGATTTGAGATTTTGAGASTATGTAGSTSPSASPTSAADSKGVAGSSLALVLCAVVGMWVLN
ncbi:Ferredoxin-fold anticodon-binding domain-containing protein 1 [Lambiella insularis]|nr:Ferredoxin-fold anticodon-binding domain-containing protein 1 [Lambiella insularis]